MSSIRIGLGLAITSAVVVLVPAAPVFAHVVTVEFDGTGTGTVTSIPAGINCSNVGGGVPGPGCSFDFPPISTVSFTAEQDDGSTFTAWAWSGATGLNNTCLSPGTANPCGFLTAFGVQSSTLTAVFNVSAEPPEVEFDDVTDNIVVGEFENGAFSADLRGFVNPTGGGLDQCRFEWVPDGAPGGFGDAQAQSAECDPDLTDPAHPDSDSHNPVEVTAAAEGLEANTTYRFRLLAAKAGATPASEEATPPLTTDAVAPEIVSVIATPGATMATFHARVDPHNSGTSWRLDYRRQGGEDWRNAGGGGAGAGGAPVDVFARAERLEPQAEYEFRIVAESVDGGPAEPVQGEFSTSKALPARAYELVSPVPTGGVSAYSIWTGGENGDHFLFTTLSIPLPGPDAPHGYYLASRGETGWTSVPVDAPPQGPTWFGGGFAYASPDASRVLIGTQSSLDPDDQNNVEDLYLRHPDGETVWISRDPRIPPGTPQTDPAPVVAQGSPQQSTMSADGSTVLFRSRRQLLDVDTTPGTTPRLYKWSDGELSLAGVLPDGTLSASGSQLGSGSQFIPNAVSRDGSRSVFSSIRPGAGNARALYVQVDGQPSIEASAACSACPVGLSDPLAVTYAGADRDVDHVFFTSETRLTPNSGAANSSGGGADLYRYDVDSETLHDLTPRLDGGTDPTITPSIGNRARVRGVVSVAGDGSNVYFVAEAVLTTSSGPFGRTPEEGAPNLYVHERDETGAGETRFIATLPEGDGNMLWPHLWNNKEARTSPDGSVLAFTSAGALTGQPVGGTPQLYVYDDDTGELVCASCPGDGSPPAGRVNAGADPSVFISNQGWAIRRWVSTDGAVFFHTPTPLLATDTNQVDDVYEYRRGELRILSAGSGSQASHFFDASADGSTVFFRTADALVPEDGEPGTAKIYAARVGGGFPSPAAPPSPCEGDDCKDQPPGAPQFDGAGSSHFAGPGNTAGELDCAQLRRQSRRFGRRARRQRLRGLHLARQAERQARRGNVQRSNRLAKRSRRARRQARAGRQRAQRLARRTQRCARGQENRGSPDE